MRRSLWDQIRDRLLGLDEFEVQERIAERHNEEPLDRNSVPTVGPTLLPVAPMTAAPVSRETVAPMPSETTLAPVTSAPIRSPITAAPLPFGETFSPSVSAVPTTAVTIVPVTAGATLTPAQDRAAKHLVAAVAKKDLVGASSGEDARPVPHRQGAAP